MPRLNSMRLVNISCFVNPTHYWARKNSEKPQNTPALDRNYATKSLSDSVMMTWRSLPLVIPVIFKIKFTLGRARTQAIPMVSDPLTPGRTEVREGSRDPTLQVWSKYRHSYPSLVKKPKRRMYSLITNHLENEHKDTSVVALEVGLKGGRG